MTLPASCLSDHARSGLLLPSLKLRGEEHMALDAYLLEKCWTRALNQPALRFYHWIRPSLSLGRNQREIPFSWIRLAKTGQLELIRRPSGGGAVLHAGGLTYALVWPEAPRRRQEAYRQVNSWITKAFAEIGVCLNPGQSPVQASTVDCFARSTPADLVDTQGTKRIGSAQFWQHGHLLQHGEIALTPPANLWRTVFGNEPPRWTPQSPDVSAVESALMSSFSKGLSILRWTDQLLSSEELSLIQQRSEGYRLTVSEV